MSGGGSQFLKTGAQDEWHQRWGVSRKGRGSAEVRGGLGFRSKLHTTPRERGSGYEPNDEETKAVKSTKLMTAEDFGSVWAGQPALDWEPKRSFRNGLNKGKQYTSRKGKRGGRV